MNKELIQKRFAKNLTTYDSNAKVQKLMAERLISLVPEKFYDSILEIGCGTGFLTKCAIDKLNFQKYIANDIVPECEAYILSLNKDINFVHADIEKILNQQNNKYDLILSNATFQWVESLEPFIKSLMQKLNPNGVLIFSTFGVENFKEIFEVTGKTLPYKQREDYEKMFKNYDFEIDEEIRVLNFKTPKDILKHLKYTGVNAISSESWTKKDLNEFERMYKSICWNFYTLTYHPIYIKLTNKSSG